MSAREGWLLGAGPAAMECGSQSIWLWHTVDAGASWARGVPSGIADGSCAVGLTFAAPMRGYLVTERADSAPVIYRTDDGGTSWIPSRPWPDPPGFATRGGDLTLHPGKVRSLGSTLLVEAGGIGLSGGPQRYVFRSTDGGATWSHAATLANPGGTVAFVTASRWLHLFEPTRLTETTDGGSSWHPYDSNYAQAAPIAPTILFGDPLIGYATVRGGIQRTTDGGKTWTALRTPGTY